MHHLFVAFQFPLRRSTEREKRFTTPTRRVKPMNWILFFHFFKWTKRDEKKQRSDGSLSDLRSYSDQQRSPLLSSPSTSCSSSSPRLLQFVLRSNAIEKEWIFNSTRIISAKIFSPWSAVLRFLGRFQSKGRRRIRPQLSPNRIQAQKLGC